MGSYINVFLKTELTVIPGLLDKYIGKYYNNTLCNGATWMFATWFVLHLLFDDLLNSLLIRMKYKNYIRVRLKRSLWYLGFYSTACIYCAATLFRNNLPIINMKEPFDSTHSPSGHLVLGFIVMLTFYLHCAFWEGLKHNNVIFASSYLCLFFLLFFSYFLRFVEGTFRLTVFICSTQITLELARCITLIGKNTLKMGAFIVGILTFTFNCLIAFPIFFGIPLVREFSPFVAILLICLTTWLIIESYESILRKAILHWTSHRDVNDKVNCDMDIFECSLFPPRSDATSNLIDLRRQIKEREELLMKKRKPKNRNVVFQTLKCMVAIKKKLHEKRQSRSKIEEATSNVEEDDHKDEEKGSSGSSIDPEEQEVVDGKLAFNIACPIKKCKPKLD